MSNTTPEGISEIVNEAAKALEESIKMLQAKELKPTEVLGLLEKAIDPLNEINDSLDEKGRYILAKSLMNRGTFLLSSNDPKALPEAQKNFQAAMDNYNKLPIRHNETYLADCTALWSNIAHGQMKSNNMQGTQAAIECFEKALSFLNMLPWENNAEFRNHLIGIWFNIGNAHQKLNGKPRVTGALNAYNMAIVFSQDLPTDSANNALLVSNIWNNRGMVFSKVKGDEAQTEGTRSFDKSIEILEGLKGVKNPNITLQISRSYASKASLISGVREKAEESRKSIESNAQKALDLSSSLLKQAPMAAENTLMANRSLAQCYTAIMADVEGGYSEELYSKTTDIIDESMSLIREWEKKGAQFFRQAARQLFFLGTQLYQARQPHFLAEFINETINEDEAIASDPHLIEIARNSIQESLKRLDTNTELSPADLSKIKDPLNELLEQLPKKAGEQ
ncbi:hypothetical protein MLD52_06420 [Puniceicoccaceae bacterium K14]|nr:hypothetical protein [Puniceicoccaceae bacterium K14]